MRAAAIGLALIMSTNIADASLVAPGSDRSDGGLVGEGVEGTFDSYFVLGPTNPGKWGQPELGTGATISYSFATGTGYRTTEFESGGTIVSLESFMPFSKQEIEAEIRRALDAWEAVANIKFEEVPDDGQPFGFPFSSSGAIRIGGHEFDGPRETLAHGYFPPSILASGSGDFHFDVAENWKIGYGGEGYDIFQVAVHEIGHAIGLDHTEVPTSLMNAIYSEDFVGPQADDIAGAVFLYGPVPEPSSIVIGVVGVLLLALARISPRAENSSPTQSEM